MSPRAVLRKAVTLLTRPGAVLAKYRRIAREAPARERLAGLTSLAMFDARPPEAIAPVWSDLLFLYTAVRERRPTTLLEFGCGCSTFILAQALVDNGEGHLYSIDAFAEWADLTRRTLPERLATRVTLLHCAAEEIEFDGVAGFRHVGMPELEPDMVYLDGPPLTEERPVATDLAEMRDLLAARCLIVVDGRTRNCDFLERQLPDFERRSDATENRTVFERRGAAAS